MIVFRAWLVVIFLSLLVYTGIVVAEHGPNLFPAFFGDMTKLGWPGQFNLDFLFMLTLSATWVAWRHRFSGPGLGLGLLAAVGGALFLSVYLLIVSTQCGGDPRRLLLGEN